MDIEPVRIEEANAEAKKAGVTGRVRFAVQDFHQAGFGEAAVVTIYLYTRVMTKLKPKLLAELKPRARVVADQFKGMGDWKPKKTVNKHRHPVSLWIVPSKRKEQGQTVSEIAANRRRVQYARIEKRRASGCEE